MKKIYLTTILVFAFSLLLTACSPKLETEKDVKDEIKVAKLMPIEKKVQGINFIIDPRIELLAAIQSIGKYDEEYSLITDLQFQYKQELMNYFSGFSEHEAVVQFDKMSQSAFSFDAPPTFMLYLTDTLEMTNDKVLPDDLTKRVGEKSSIEEFIKSLGRFSVDTKFEQFYEEHNAFYETVINNTGNKLEENYCAQIEDYYGAKQNSYNIILSPMFHSGGFGPRIENEDGSYDIYSIIGPGAVINNEPDFGTKEGLKYLVLHEFGHSFVNPLTDKYSEEVSSYEALFKPISKQMNSMAYNKWDICLNEHILRAASARFALDSGGESAYQQVIELENQQGFIYVKALADKMGEYEKNRDKYKTFEDFYPELLTALKK